MAVEQAFVREPLRKRPQAKGLGGCLRWRVVDAPIAVLDPGEVA